MNKVRTRMRKGDFEREKREKPGPRPDFAGVHAERNLRQMIKESLTNLYGGGFVSDCSDELVEAVLRQVDHWFQDQGHTYRMAKKTEEQVIVDILRRKSQV